LTQQQTSGSTEWRAEWNALSVAVLALSCTDC